MRFLEMEDGNPVVNMHMTTEMPIALGHENIAVVLPGGMEGVRGISNSIAALELIKRTYHSKNGIVGAICAAPTMLKKAGIVGKDIKLTAYPAFEAELSELYTWGEHGIPVFRSGSRSQLITRFGFGLM